MTIERANDHSIIVRFKPWSMRAETIPRLALHVHGDEAALAASDDIVQAMEVLYARAPMDMAELDASVQQLGRTMNLAASATDCRCMLDPLDTVVDVSFYQAGSQSI